MYRNLLICLFASIALVCAQSSTKSTSIDGASPVKPSVSPPSNHSTTNSPSNSTTTTTVAPTSSSTPTTKKTEPPTTTKTPTTTTAKPITSTVEPTPPPVPKPEKFSGKVTEGNKTCIIVEFAVRITIKYNNTHNEEKTTGFTIPANATVDSKSSHCGANASALEAITIGFKDQEHTSADLTLTFNTTANNVFVEEVKLSFVATPELMPAMDSTFYGKTLTAEKNELNLFKVASVHSYVCSAGQWAQLNLSQESRITDVQIEFTDSKVEAYINESNKGKFDSEIDCKSADISDVVPIAVGAALAGLVIIVLIAYFIGRRRSRRLAYQSV